MKIKGILTQKVCLQYCSYYKPGKDEALACRGYSVVERFLREGKILALDGHGRERKPGTAELMIKAMCTACDFFEQDCDFMQDRSAPPCGGFVLLEHLLRTGMITIEELT
jgi:hypothetical protein